MSGRLGVFAGTFDPVTLGHLDILSRARNVFDEVVVAVADRHHKQPLFTAAERVTMFSESLDPVLHQGVRVQKFEGLLVEFGRSLGANALIRGLRFVSDFEYEFQMALMNQKLAPDLVTIFLMPSEKFTVLNSTLVKEIVRSGGSVEGLVPPAVAARLRDRLGPGSSDATPVGGAR